MKRRLVILISLTAMVMAAGWWLLFAPAAVKEPMVHGQRLSYWFTDEGITNRSIPLPKLSDGLSTIFNAPNENCEVAAATAGTNAIPVLLGLLRAHNDPLVLLARRLLQKQHFFQIRFTASSNLNQRAVSGFAGILGSSAAAIPELIKICDERISDSSRAAAIRTLGQFGPEAAMAVPSLVKALSVREKPLRASPASIINNSLLQVHEEAFDALQQINANWDLALPAMTNELGCTNLNHRQQALVILVGHSRLASNDLVAIMRGRDDELQSYALNLIGNYYQNPSLTLPGLIAALDAANGPTLIKRAAKIAEFMGPSAAPAIPALRQLTNSPRQEVSVAAVAALQAIEAEPRKEGEDK